MHKKGRAHAHAQLEPTLKIRGDKRFRVNFRHWTLQSFSRKRSTYALTSVIGERNFCPKSKRSISPVIATVLLIAMVVVISLIVFLWFRSLMKESITKSEENIELVCDKVEFDASYSESTLYVSNIGNIPIYSLNVKTGSGLGHETKNINDLSSEWPETGLNQGGDFSDDIVLEGEITISPILLGLSDGEEKTYDCDIERYGKEI